MQRTAGSACCVACSESVCVHESWVEGGWSGGKHRKHKMVAKSRSGTSMAEVEGGVGGVGVGYRCLRIKRGAAVLFKPHGRVPIRSNVVPAPAPPAPRKG
jgi:hypothetical protein